LSASKEQHKLSIQLQDKTTALAMNPTVVFCKEGAYAYVWIMCLRAQKIKDFLQFIEAWKSKVKRL